MTSRRTLCSVSGCDNNVKFNRHLSFFTLPKDDERRGVWLELIGRPDLLQKDFTRDLRPASHCVCSEHFDSSMIILIPKLKPEAIPTKNLPGKRKPSYTFESETIDSDSSFNQGNENSNSNEQPTTQMVEIVVPAMEERYVVETVQVKQEKVNLETVHIEEEIDVPVTIPLEVNVKVEKLDSENEHVEGEKDNWTTVLTQEEKQQTDTETCDSLPIKPVVKIRKALPDNLDTPSTSTCKPTNNETELEICASTLDTSTQTKFSKIKKSRKQIKYIKIVNDNDNRNISMDSAGKRTHLEQNDFESKRKRV